ncbi:hypothetical protein ROJ8625_01409 [Roseivivax jejudonensis]|uniref:DUF4156 domain-containing protein n=1 Tax=Roseivivax jejudonensis TaxID=1529041 RepID=A0A1X6YUN3_9RHOB|nr:hypothetical protein [Roseivivax jejudonensis]SLN31149.1 hypothetical protein ROJ8625_01409 [Roseivivax jejudonensis]
MKPLHIMIMAGTALAACGTELSDDARGVRQISLAASERCTFVGPVEGVNYFGLTAAQDARSALNKVRNAVAARGGNAFVLTQTLSADDGTVSSADAYLC